MGVAAVVAVVMKFDLKLATSNRQGLDIVATVVVVVVGYDYGCGRGCGRG